MPELKTQARGPRRAGARTGPRLVPERGLERRATKALSIALAIVVMLVLTASAGAVTKVVGQFGSAGTGDGQFAGPYGVAIEISGGDVLVADSGNDRIQRFDTDGAFVDAFGTSGSGDGQLDDPRAIAIDQSDGSVYVADTGNDRVVKFDSNGAFVLDFGSAGSGDGQFGDIENVKSFDVDAAGNVLIPDPANNRIQKFDSTGGFVAAIGTPGTEPGQLTVPEGLSLDSAGNQFVLDQAGGSRVQKFDASGSFVSGVDTGATFLAVSNIAVDAVSDHLYAKGISLGFVGTIVEYDATGAAVDELTEGLLFDQQPLDVADGRGYVVDVAANQVQIFEHAVPPSVVTGAASKQTTTGATVSGQVNPNGVETTFQFEYGTTAAYGLTAPVPAQSAGAGTSSEPVSVDLVGLTPGTTYHYRLVAVSVDGPAAGADMQFTTKSPPPAVTTLAATDVTVAAAALQGTVNPNGASVTACTFEYGTTTAYSGSAPCASAPGSGAKAVSVSAALSGLQPATVYHYRLKATNAGGTVEGTDQAFTTGSAPDPCVVAPASAGCRPDPCAVNPAACQPAPRPLPLPVPAPGKAKVPGTAKVQSGKALLKVTCAGADGTVCKGTLKLTAQLPARGKGRKGKVPTVIGRTSFSVPSGSAKVVRVALSKKARRLIAKKGSLKATIGGAVSRKITLTAGS